MHNITKRLGAIILACALITSCNNARRTIKREGKPDIVQTSDDDAELNRAILYAKAHYHQFLEAAYNEDTTEHGFHVKLKFPTPEGHEHIWLSDLVLGDDSLFGYVANTPNAVENLKLGQEVYIDTSLLSDWYYIKDHKLIGGWTIKILVRHADKEEIREIENMMGCEIDFRE